LPFGVAYHLAFSVDVGLLERPASVGSAFTESLLVTTLVREVPIAMKRNVALLGMLVLLLALAACNGNRKPAAAFFAVPMEGVSPLTVEFDASMSFDIDGAVIGYFWDFGDGTTGTQERTTHVFASNTDRTFTVRLTVRDDGGKTDSITLPITVIGSGLDPSPGDTLFFDDFEDGLDPAWQHTAGWEAVDGVLAHNSGHTIYTYLGIGTDWTDYIVEVDLEPSDRWAGLLLRCQEDLDSYVMFYGYHGSLRFRTVADGDVTAYGEEKAPGFLEGVQHVRVVVSGSTYDVYVNGLHRLTYTDDTYSTGMPGLRSWPGPGARFDNFRVTSSE